MLISRLNAFFQGESTENIKHLNLCLIWSSKLSGTKLYDISAQGREKNI